MKFHGIKNINDKYYPCFSEIYKSSFPPHEQRNHEQQLLAFQNNNYHLDCLIEEENMLSFISYWNFDNYIYIEHYAVNSLFRDRKIGSIMLQQFIKQNPKQILLEIDPIVDTTSNRRLNFYQRLGFVENPYTHFHPAYSRKFQPHQLIVLSYRNVISQNQYDSFLNDLKTIIMNNA